jgi:hypothetical protein
LGEMLERIDPDNVHGYRTVSRTASAQALVEVFETATSGLF